MINISLVWCPGQNKRIAPLSFLDVVEVALTPEIDYNKTAMIAN
jgi:hypothetical protein